MAGQMVEIRWHARGGQGAKTAAIFLAEAVLEQGKYGQGFPEYGPERRGAPVRGYTRICDEPIRRHCAIENPGIVIILDPTLLDSPAAGVTLGATAETIFLVNTTETPATIAGRLGIEERRVFTVDATGIALACFKKPIPNMPMIGALLSVSELMSIEDLQATMRTQFARKFTPEVLEGNLQAVQRAHEELVAA